MMTKAMRWVLWLPGVLCLFASVAEARIEYKGFEISGSFFQFGEFRFGGKANEHSFILRNDLALLDVNSEPGNAGPVFGIFQTRDWSERQKYRNVNSFRNQLRLEMTYHDLPYITPVLKLHPFWDGMYAWENKDTQLSNYWEHNLGKQDRWDPLVREAYVDINLHPFFLRAGRQLITWGRSDGVSVLDTINPNNFRSPLIFEQENFRIPLWMLNFNYDLGRMTWIPGIQKELQVIWNLRYQPARFPGFTPGEEGKHPWTINVVDFADQVIKAQEDVFAEEGFFDNYKWSDRDFLDQTELFVRWQGRVGEGLGIEPFKDFTYSFHFANLLYRIPVYHINNRMNLNYSIWITSPRDPANINNLLALPDNSSAEVAGDVGPLQGIEHPGQQGGIDFTTKRYNLVGVSLDKALTFLPGQFEGTVLRTEAAYNFGNNTYDPDLNDRRRDNFTALIGLDQYLYLAPRWVFETPWFTSFQVFEDYIMDEPEVGRFTRLGSMACDRSPYCGKKGFIDIGAFDLFNGLRDQQRTVLTLFMFNDFLSGKSLRVELFGLHELEQQGTWFRGLVGYAFNSTTSARLGYHQLWGQRDSFFGQFKDNQEVFTEVKYTF
jgi:hypothetical protein